MTCFGKFIGLCDFLVKLRMISDFSLIRGQYVHLPNLVQTGTYCEVITLFTTVCQLAGSRFFFCFTMHVETLDEGTVLQALHNETNWAVVTNKCCCKSIGVKCSTKCHVGSDCWLKLYFV